MKRQSGFTLVEVLVVVAVIGMVASMAIPVFQGAMDKTRRNAAFVGLRVLNEAMEQYHGDTGAFPSYFAFDTLSLSPIVPDHLKSAAPVLRHLSYRQLYFYLPWDIFSPWIFDKTTMERPSEYTVFAQLAYDDDAYVLMTDKQTWFWNGKDWVPVSRLN